MIHLLNTIFQDNEQRIVCTNLATCQDISLDELQCDLSNLRQKLSNLDANSWLLSTDNAYLFLLGFLVLTGLNRTVIICANRKLDWLESFSEQYDAILSDQKLDMHNKAVFDFTLSNSATESWFPCFDGNEKIIFFTSGSTGLPKAIEKSLLGLTNEVAVLEKTFNNSTKNLTFVSSVSHLHIYGLLFKLLWPLMTRRSWENCQIDYPEQLIDVAKQYEAFIFISSPAFLSRLDLSLEQVYPDKIFSSGGPLSLEAASQSETYFGQLPIEVYGSTETGGIAYRQQHHIDMPWTLFADVQLKVTEKDIELSSPYILHNTKVILDDRLEFNNSGQFKLKGRTDRVVKLEEKRVSLTEIEQFLEAFDTILECVAIIVPGDRQVIGCVLVLSQAGLNICTDKGFRYLIRQCKQAMKQRFEAVTIPRKWRQLSEIPVNSQSKLDTGIILAQFEQKRINRMQLPEVISYNKTQKGGKILLDISAKLSAFDGHFDSIAIVPGVVQIQWAIAFANLYLDKITALDIQRLDKVKFQHVITSDSKVTLNLEMEATHLMFSYVSEHRKHSSGKIVIG